VRAPGGPVPPGGDRRVAGRGVAAGSPSCTRRRRTSASWRIWAWTGPG
jgi:hypothetical protein